jgi:asparagine synthase (glutamine-hydrolysing)
MMGFLKNRINVCGIAGIIGNFSKEVTELMVAKMHHRGPDDQGVWASEHAVLGMSRLSIIDLSPAGHQPMSTPNGRYWIVYNGEVYNFQQKRRMLEQKGHVFISNSDTEVVLHLYQEYGHACLEHLRGMFAFAVWDTFECTLFAARDQLGIKPFLYSELPGKGFIFASEVKALLASGLVKRDVDWYSFQNYLLLGSVQPPRTMVAGVNALLPGQYLTYRDGRLDINTYWDITAETTPAPFQGDLQGAAQELRHLFSESIEEQQISDVPVGVFLSGGLDSASVLALMAKGRSLPVKSFSVGFEKTNQDIDETQFAVETARYIGSDHYNIIVTADDVESSLDHFISGLDQPSIDGLNSYFVSRFARSKVTVALSGIGGDELFAGYSRARRILAGQSMPAFFRSSIFKSASYKSAKALTRFSLKNAHRVKYHLADRFDLVSNYAVSHQVFSEFELAHYLDGGFWSGCRPVNAADMIRSSDRSDLSDPWKRISCLDIKTFMAPQLLRDMDAVGMIHSLEVRFPLLDIRIVDFARSLPLDLVFDNSLNSNDSSASTNYASGQVKRILVEATRDTLPKPLIGRKKVGFALPYRSWLEGSLSSRVKETLTSDRLIDSPFSRSSIQSILKDFEHNHASWKKVWALLIFFGWQRSVLQGK